MAIPPRRPPPPPPKDPQWIQEIPDIGKDVESCGSEEGPDPVQVGVYIQYLQLCAMRDLHGLLRSQIAIQARVEKLLANLDDSALAIGQRVLGVCDPLIDEIKRRGGSAVEDVVREAMAGQPDPEAPVDASPAAQDTAQDGDPTPDEE